MTITRHLLAPALLGLALAAPAAAQDQTDLQAKYEAKLADEFVSYGGWITDYDQARKIAKEQGKLIFTYFTRSYSP
ncbi:MAG: hypothetical protein ISR76_07495 [Planctomycetes bacterium]|nr:hypothetical protein [Planctomycetota bacterium]MBL7008827.1 hypothetical protein [Planctomycetota bacterium]